MVNKIPTIFLQDEVLELGTVTDNVTAKTILEFSRKKTPIKPEKSGKISWEIQIYDFDYGTGVFQHKPKRLKALV